MPAKDKTWLRFILLLSRSQEVFRQAMSSPTVRLEVLPVGNKTRHEKSFIGQLFTADGRDASAKAKSPVPVRAKTEFQPDSKPNAKQETRLPDTRTKTPEPSAANAPLAERQSGHESLERASPALLARAASESPTPGTGSQSPLPSKSPVVPGLPNLTSRRGGKRIKIDLKKGNRLASVIPHVGLLVFLTIMACHLVSFWILVRWPKPSLSHSRQTNQICYR